MYVFILAKKFAERPLKSDWKVTLGTNGTSKIDQYAWLKQSWNIHIYLFVHVCWEKCTWASNWPCNLSFTKLPIPSALKLELCDSCLHIDNDPSLGQNKTVGDPFGILKGSQQNNLVSLEKKKKQNNLVWGSYSGQQF